MCSEIAHEPKLSMKKVSAYIGIALGVIAITFMLVIYFYPDLYINKYFKSRIIKEFTSAYPCYSINISNLQFNPKQNCIEFGSIEVNSGDSNISCSIEKPSIRGIGWIPLIWNGVLGADVLSNSITEVKSIVLKFRKSQYEVRCGRLRVSLYDSEIIANDLRIYPLVDNDQFFDESKFRKTRLSMTLPQLKISGLTYLGLLHKQIYHAELVQMGAVSLDVLVNICKPVKQDTSKILKTSESLASIKDIIHVDSLNISNIQIKYAEIDSACSDRDYTGLYPGYCIKLSNLNSSIPENRIKLSSLDINSNDSTFLCSIAKSSLNKIDWLRLVKKGIIASDSLAVSVIDVQGIAVKSGEFEYSAHCGRLNVSLGDSEIVVNDLEVHPLLEDNQFFEESKYRKTGFRLTLPQLKANGLNFNDLLKGETYNSRFIQISDASLDVMVSMYKPYKRSSSKTLMINELHNSIKKIINVDSLSISSSHLTYKERYSARANPAFLTFDNIHALIKGVSNNNELGDTIVIMASTIFAKGGVMKMLMYIPLSSPKFSLRYTGSVSKMELNKLNTFLEIGEHYRIKSGIVHHSTCNVQVKNGKATGNVRAVYEDLKFALLDPKSGSENGIFNKLKSFFANTIKIHGTNMPDKSGNLKLGKVNYSRKRDDTFIQFAWFALRSGIANIVGF